MKYVRGEKQKSYDFTDMWNLKQTNEQIKTKVISQTQRTDGSYQRGRGMRCG